MIQLLLSVSDWPIIMIRPGGLLLVVPHLFAVPVSVLWVGLAKEYITKLGCEKYFHRVAYCALTAGEALMGQVRVSFLRIL